MNIRWIIMVWTLLFIPLVASAQEDAAPAQGTAESAQAEVATESEKAPETVADALSLDELLDAVRSGRIAEEQANQVRMQRFRTEQANQQKMLKDIVTEENRE